MSDEKFGRFEDKLDRVVERIGSIDSTLAAQHVSLSEHIRRTNILEDKLAPVEKHVAMVGGAIKFIGILATVAGFVGVCFEMLGVLHR